MDSEDMHTSLLDHEKRLSALEHAAKQPTGIEGMTLAQLEAMAERLGSAAKTIRDAQALLGGPVRVQNATLPDNFEPGEIGPPAPAPGSLAAHRLRQLQPPEQAPASKGSQLRSHELAAKRALMDQFAAAAPVDPSLPDDIAAMERE